MNSLKKITSAVVALSLGCSHFLSAATLSNQSSVQKEPQSLISIGGKEYIRYGDMLLLNESELSRSQFDLTKNAWVDGNVYYAFAEDVSLENRQQFIKATEIWSEVAQLTFIERTEEANYIFVENGTGNFATVGMVGGQQTLTMNNWESLYIVVHEIGHSLGMWHEQQRSDRDNFVEIKMENVLDNQTHNFTLKNTSAYGTYDFLSIMHYNATAWTKNGLNTIQPKAGYEQFTTHMGQRSYISGGDQYSVANHYGAVTLSIPDPAFKSYLIENFDTSGDGEIDSLEAAQVEEIHTPGNGEINSIEGIKYFRFLKVLDVSGENLSSVPALPNHVVELDFSDNQFAVFDSSWALPPMVNNIVATGNPVDEYSCDDISFMQATIDGELTLNPTQNGSTIVCDETASYVLYDGKTRFDLRSKSPQTYNIDVPAGIAELTFETTNFESVTGGEMDIYIAFNRQPSVSDYDYQSNNAGNIESQTISNPEAGRWFILLQPTERSFESVNLTARFGDSSVPSNVLVNGQIRTDIQAIKDKGVEFVIDVPENSTNLSFQLAGGTGDADLYVKYSQAPTLNDYDCRPWKTGNQESCVFSTPQVGRYYVLVQGYSDFSGVSLLAEFEEGDVNSGGSERHDNLSATTGKWLDFPIEIPAGMTQLTATISGGSGDADLYVKQGGQPTTSSYDCRPYQTGNNEVCNLANPAEGNWYVSVRSYASFNNVSLVIEWQ